MASLIYSTKSLWIKPLCRMLDFVKQYMPAHDMEVRDDVVFLLQPDPFDKRLGALRDSLKSVRKLVFLSDDYKWKLITQVRQGVQGKPNELWSTYAWRGKGVAWDWIHKQLYMNWNALGFEPEPNAPPKSKDFIYWGTHREGRDFSMIPEWGDVSTTNRSMKKFKRRCFEKLPFREIAKYRRTLYLEDREQSEIYSSPANRFYEALALGLYIHFSPGCVKTFDTFGVDVRPWVVSEVPREFELTDQSGLRSIAERQREILSRRFERELERINCEST